ncbi:phospholipase D-like domain-containing protein [Azotobacter sp. CWF10]
MTITRYSSRIVPLDESFLIQHLKGAKRYRRIAGYFTSSLFEVAGELVAQIHDVQIVCNADIRKEDLMVAQLGEARLLGRLNERSVEVEALLNRKRYRLLANFLDSHGPVIRVVPDELCGLVHGKAGVIDLADGRKIGFIGSMNESRNGWQGHYEILWSDESPEGIAWIEAEFDYLWRGGVPLPKAIWKEVARRADRHEILLPDVDRPEDMAPAALIESPLYREGFALQPWQQGFANECVKQYQVHGSVRLLLADEVGLGKTLSLATGALALSLLESQKGVKKPVVIFAPATLCVQWQVELLDKLGLPCARWDSRIKQWLDHDEHAISPKGASYIVKCPLRIGIISTGLMMQDSEEKAELLNRRGDYGVVVLDEAHKARTKQGYGKDAGEANNLLDFARRIAERADHVLLGTATPIQTRAEDLWDMVGILGWGAKGQFVLGADYQSLWRRPRDVLPILTGEYRPVDVREAWPLLCSPLPRKEMSIDPRVQALYSAIRTDLGHGPEVVTARQDAYLNFDDRDIPERIEDEIARACY